MPPRPAITNRPATRENKSENRGVFFITTTTTTNSPQSTINSPQIHHQKTIRKTRNPFENRALHHYLHLIPAKTRIQIDSTQVSLRQIHVSGVYTRRNMSTSTISSGISADEFQALEQKVLRAVEIVKKEREARATAEAEVASLREELASFKANARAVEAELNTLNKERDAVRVRVEKMLQQMDELL
jgi:chromosome segregation ATPase